MASADVKKAIAKHKKDWGDARKTKPGEFSIPKVPDGEYACQVKAQYGVKKAELWARLTWTILKGKNAGKSSSAFFGLGQKDADRRLAAWKSLAAAVQVLTGEDTSSEDYKNDPELLLGLLDQINKDKPKCMVKLANGKSEKGTEYINARFEELVDEEGSSRKKSKGKKSSDDDDEEDDEEDDSESDDDSDEDDDDDESDDEDEDESEEEDEDEEEEKPKRGKKKAPVKKKAPAKKKKSSKDEEDDEDGDEDGEEEDDEEDDDDVQTPEKEDIVDYRPKGAKKDVTCEVITVNTRAETVTLKEQDGKERTFKSVPWDALKY